MEPMQRVARVVCGIGVATLALVVATPRAQACSCLPPLSALESRDAAVAVFEGFVLTSTVDPPSHSRTVRFQVMRAWKGVDVDTVVSLYTPDNSAACGVNAQEGELMLVYAMPGTVGWTFVLCSRTVYSTWAADDFTALGAPMQIGVLAPGALGGAAGTGGTTGIAGAGGTTGIAGAGGTTGIAGAGGATGIAGAGGTTGLVHAGGCAVAGRPAPGIALGAAGVVLALAVARRRRRR
jgi:hypothetical protein